MKKHFMVYEKNFESILKLCMAAMMGAIVVFIGGALIHDLLSNTLVLEVQKVVGGIDTLAYMLATIGAVAGALVYYTCHQHFVKKCLKQYAERHFDEAVKKGVIFAVKEAYKDLSNSNGKLHNSKISLLFSQANNAVAIATLGDMDVTYVSETLRDAFKNGRELSKVSADIPEITGNVSPIGFNVTIRLNGEYLRDPRDPNP